MNRFFLRSPGAAFCLFILSALASLPSASAQETVLYSFDSSTSGASGVGLTLSGGTLYGTANSGGGAGVGTLFGISTSGSNFQVLYTFGASSTDAQNPSSSPVLSGSTLYGAAFAGGNAGGANAGAFYSIGTSGSNYQIVHSFQGGPSDGTNPAGSLALSTSGDTFYGVTVGGGTTNPASSYGYGTVYALSGSTDVLLHTFGISAGDGAAPQAGVTLSGSTLYGTTSMGGTFAGGTYDPASSGNGTVYSIGTNGSNYQVLFSFNGTNGSQPYSALTQSGSTLYGTTQFGGTYGVDVSSGSYGAGTLYEINTSGSDFQVLHDFGSGTDGVNPQGNLLLSGSMLYGTTQAGGSSSDGTIFEISTTGLDYQVLFSFNGTDGSTPVGSLILSGNTLYGVTSVGGTDGGNGVIFSFSLSSSTSGLVWTGSTSQDWNTASNWSGTSVPTGTSNVVIDIGTGRMPILTGGVDPTGSTANIVIGESTSGNTLVINGSGTLVSTGSAIIGDQAGATGSVKVAANSVWSVTNGVIVGNSGSGGLTIQTGGSVLGGTDSIGSQSTGVGTGTVTGTGSQWSDAALIVGDAGSGALSILNGGSMTTTGSSIIGNQAGASGVVTVSGTGAHWSDTSLAVGNSGTGVLVIANGGSVTTTGAVGFGDLAGSWGSGTVAGPGSLWNVGGLVVGGHGAGQLAILNSGTVIANGLTIVSIDAGSSGLVTVSGTGSELITNGVFAGFTGSTSGTITIADGGLIHINNSGTLVLGESSGAQGTLNIGSGTTGGTLSASTVFGGSGAAVVNFGETGSWSFAPVLAGSLSVNQLGSGTTVLTGSNSYTGSTTITEGTLEAAATGAIGSGTLTVNGSTDGSATLTVDSGVLLKNGVYMQNGATLVNSGTLSGTTSNGGQTQTVVGTAGIITVFNGTTGVITGGNANGVKLVGGGTVTNYGLISAQDGVFASGGTTTVVNFGTITGSNFNGVEIAQGSVTNSGNISTVSFSGVAIRNASGTVVNSGTIIGKTAGVELDQGGVVTNTTGGVITGTGSTGDGILVQNAFGTVTNSGTINSAATGVDLTDGGVVNNAAGGYISSTRNNGIFITGASGTVTNSGTITTSGTNAVELDNGGNVTNNSGGLIASTGSAGSGIYMISGNVTNNAGGTITESGTNAAGVALVGAGALVTNAGLISASGSGASGVSLQGAGGSLINNAGGVVQETGSASVAVYMKAAGEIVTNSAGALISGTGASGVGVASASAGNSILNSGTIFGSGIGVGMTSGGTVSNLAGGVISSGTWDDSTVFGIPSGAVVISGNTGVVTNSGLISTTGSFSAVDLVNGGTVTNFAGGTISSAQGIGVEIDRVGSLVNSGFISGGSLGVSDASRSVNLVNSGTITGGVSLSDEANIVTLETGGLISGSLNIGADVTSQLILDGSGTQVYSAAVTGSTILSGTLVLNGGGTWEIDRTLNPGSTVLNQGTLQIGTGGTAGSIGTGPILDNGTLAFDLSVTTTAATISGTGSVSQTGSGTTIITGTETYTGATVVKQGTLQVLSSDTGGGNVIVGQSSGDIGTLLISQGGIVSGSDGVIGSGSNSTGSVVVDGAGSKWTASGSLIVGDLGSGTLTIRNGGTVSVTSGSNTSSIGNQAGSSGVVVVTGSASRFLGGMGSGILDVGNSGTGVLNVLAGAQVNNFTHVNIGFGNVGSVLVSGSGSQLNTFTLQVGELSSGTLSVSNGGVVNSVSDAIYAFGANSGVAVVDGTGSQWNTTTLSIGTFGTGSLTVSNGGLVSDTTAQIGANAGSSGVVLVTGTGSQWINTGSLGVGSLGSGTLSVMNGGLVSGSNLTVASGNGSLGVVDINGGTVTIGNRVAVDTAGTGILTVENGGFLGDMNGVVGMAAALSGTALVTGPGSVWSNTASLIVGQHGPGILTISNGGLVSIAGGSGTLTLANGAGSAGTLNIGSGTTAGTLQASVISGGSGTAVVDFGQTDNISFSSTMAGSLNVIQNGTGTTTLTAINTYTGSTIIQSGALALNPSTASNNSIGQSKAIVVGDTSGHSSATLDVTALAPAGGFRLNSGQTLSGYGTVSGNTAILSGGTIAPGATGTTGLLNVNGTLTFNAGSVFDVDVNGSASDDLAVTGAVSILSGADLSFDTLNLTLSSYTLMTAASGLDGTVQFTLMGASLPSDYALEYTGTSLLLVEGHPTFGSVTGTTDSPAIVTGGTTALTVSLTNTGSVPLNSTVTGSSNVVGSGSTTVGVGNTGTVTGLAFTDTTVGSGQQGVFVASDTNATNNPATGTVSVDVYGHADPIVSGSTFSIGFVHEGYTTTQTSTNSIVVSDGTTGEFIVALDGVRTTGGHLFNVNEISGVTAGNSGTLSAVVGMGLSATTLNQQVTYTFSDDSTLPGAVANVSTSTFTVTGEIYSGQSTWSGTTGGSWGTIASNFGGNWGTNQGSPGLDPDFTSTDTATFGTSVTSGTATVTLDGAAPSLAGITFSNTAASYIITQGAGNTGITLNGGASAAVLSDSGSNTIAVPLTLSTTVNVTVSNTSDALTVSGAISGSGGLTLAGQGNLILTGSNSYDGGTTIASGILQLGNGGASGSITGNVRDNGQLSFDRSDAYTFGGTISGSGGVFQIGTGTTTLAATSTFGGVLGVSQGGMLIQGSVTSGTVLIGGAQGDLEILNGGTLVSTGNIVVGSSGTGTMTVRAGGYAQDINGFVDAGGGTGFATVNGGTWVNTGTLFVGLDTVGTLSILNGGYVGDAQGTIGGNPLSAGSVLVDSGTWINTRDLVIGQIGTGSLTIQNGGYVSDVNGHIDDVPGVGVVTITGGTWANSGTLFVGESGTGTLNLFGGLVSVGSGTIFVAQNGGGTGIINVGNGGSTGTLDATEINGGAGQASLVFNHNVAGYTFTPKITGSVNVSQNGPGTTILSQANTYTGGTIINAGILQTQNNSALGAGNVTVNAGGTLQPVGTLGIGSLTLNGGTLLFTLGATPGPTPIMVSGTVNGTGATVDFLATTVQTDTNYNLVSGTATTLSLGDITLGTVSGYTATDGVVLGPNDSFTFYVRFTLTGGGGFIWNPNGGGTVNRGADYVGNGFTTTWLPTQNNTVNSLTYNTTSGSSSLTVYNTLTLTSGSFTVVSGTATVLGGNAGANILTPGDFTKGGAGALVIDPMTLNVGANANISAGALDIQQSQMLVTGNVNVSGGAALNIQQGSSLAAGGAANVSGTFNVQTGGTAAIANALNISAGGVTTVNGGGLLAVGGPANVSGVFNVQGLAASGGLNINNGGITTVSSGGVLAAGGSAGVSGLFDVQSGGAAAIAGSTSVNGGGVLTVDGALSSQQGVLVAQNGLVNGSGVIAGNVTNNGTVLPGDDPATLTVAGNYTQSSAGTLNIEVAALNNYGVLVVSGAANVGGTLLVTPFNNFKFAYGQEIPNFLVASSASGTFGTVTVDDPGYRGRVVQNGGDLSLLIAPSSYTAVAKNPNQYNVAKALNGFIPATGGDRAVVSTALDFLTASQYPTAFNAIMPDFYQTLTSMSLSLATTEGQIVDQRLSAIRMGSSGFAMQGVGNMPVYNEKGGDGKSTMDGKKDIISPAQDNHWGVWVQGNGIFGHSYSISDVPNYKFESGGFLVGGDYRWNENFSTGLFTGYQGAYGNYSSGGKVWMNGADFGVYATYDSKNGFYANAILMGAYSNYQVDRPIQFSTINRMANSTPGGGDLGAFLEAGYDFKTGGFTYGPLANAQYTYLGVAPFTERNAGSLDLSMGSQNLNSLQTNFGGHVAYTFILPNKYEIIPDLRMFWNHEFLQNPTGTQASLNGGGGPGFTYDTTTPSRDSVYAGLGINAQLGSRWNVGAYYNIDFGGYSSITHIISANLGFSW